MPLPLQQLPAQITTDDTQRLQQWGHVCSLAATVRDDELLELQSERLLYRLYHEDPVRLFDPSSIRFQCTCSRERTRNALITLHPVELQELLEELGFIAMECEFCNQEYRFDHNDLTDILEDDLSKTLH